MTWKRLFQRHFNVISIYVFDMARCTGCKTGKKNQCVFSRNHEIYECSVEMKTYYTSFHHDHCLVHVSPVGVGELFFDSHV